MSKILDTALELAGAYASSGRLTVEVKTNLGPALTVYSGDDGSRGLLDWLGIKAAVTVKRDGVPIAGYGDPPATEPLVAVALAIAVAIAAGLLVMVIRKL